MSLSDAGSVASVVDGVSSSTTLVGDVVFGASWTGGGGGAVDVDSDVAVGGIVAIHNAPAIMVAATGNAIAARHRRESRR